MYKYFKQEIISDFSDENIEKMYNQGFVFTRKGKGVMQQIKSLRVNLENFELSSENRRILRKNDNLQIVSKSLPLKEYSWKIGKMAKDFYEQKFGSGIMSANKIKEMLVSDKSNFNSCFKYNLDNKIVGYCLSYQSNQIIHYSYPFYQLDVTSYLSSIGMAMMLKAIIWAKENRKKYIYLGSYQKYKLQFKGLEIFDSNKSWII